ncbi:MAG TPA: hypothetical protein VMU99_04030 [Acidimicrobiales bacterium]|nr:hypothetical protein [Acidimicrobiales bacterium]
MIPEAFIVEWSSKVNWPTPEQVEQDLVLSLLITDFANDHKIDEFIELAGAELGEAGSSSIRWHGMTVSINLAI